MLPSDLEKYLIKCRNEGIVFDAVAQSMVKAGWSPDMVLAAKKWYLGDEQKPLIEKIDVSKIADSKVFFTPADIKFYPTNRLHPVIWVVLFVILSLVTFLILRTF